MSDLLSMPQKRKLTVAKPIPPYQKVTDFQGDSDGFPHPINMHEPSAVLAGLHLNLDAPRTRLMG